MNTLTAAAILQLLLVVGGSTVPGERNRVGCHYLGSTIERFGTLYPEDIDASLCTHLFFLEGGIDNQTHKIGIKSPEKDREIQMESLVPRLVNLKTTNPDLKLLLHIDFDPVDWSSTEPSERSNIIQSGVKWLNESGFDGLDFDLSTGTRIQEKMVDFICEMKDEFDKYGYSITTTLIGDTEVEEKSIRKVARCSEHTAILIFHQDNVTHRVSPMSMIKSNVDTYVEKGLPSSKILLIVPVFGMIFTLEDPADTKLGARFKGPGNEDEEKMGGFTIRNRDLLKKMNDSSLEWTIHRDDETKEPYAFTTTGLWTSYEDIASMEYKADYVLERGLGGIVVAVLEFEDIGGEGRYPLMRTVFNKFFQGNQPVNTRD